MSGSTRGSSEKKFDVCVVGGGILGTCIAFWISELFDLSVALVDKEGAVGTHASSRNTGVVHRPFYMNPEKRGRLAKAANASYSMWEALAKKYALPWRRTGIIEVAVEDDSLPVLGDYLKWGAANGMGEDEMRLLDASEVKKIEPLVDCKGGMISTTDAAVEYQRFTECILSLAESNGVAFLGGGRLSGVKTKDGESHSLNLEGQGDPLRIECGLLVNSAGGGALRIAHSMGLAREFAELHFRGDYWSVDDPKVRDGVSHSIYSVPKRSEYPFLDPHLVLRADGRVEIGPNAALVAGPYVYEGFGGAGRFASELFASPVRPKLRLLVDSGFLSLVRDEWRRSVSKKAMCERVKDFIPSLDDGMLGKKGVGGVRNSLIDGKGFVPEVVEEWSDHSVHVLNYNSPGATGAPAFSAQLVSRLAEKGYLNGRKREVHPHSSLWNVNSTN